MIGRMQLERLAVILGRLRRLPEEFVAPADIFGDYAYFSSYSTSWVEHARRYA